jgi:hypothetical protein
MQPATLLNPLADTFNGPAIVTRYLAGSSRIVATHKRGAGETERLSLPHYPGWDALAACRELLAACAAGADAEALALPLALARDALAPGGVTSPPVVAGFALMARPERVEVRDLFGQALFSLPDTYSPVHAMACAEAAGWVLTAETRGLAQRFRDLGGGEPSPDGVAVARAARGLA